MIKLTILKEEVQLKINENQFPNHIKIGKILIIISLSANLSFVILGLSGLMNTTYDFDIMRNIFLFGVIGFVIVLSTSEYMYPIRERKRFLFVNRIIYLGILILSANALDDLGAMGHLFVTISLMSIINDAILFQIIKQERKQMLEQHKG